MKNNYLIIVFALLILLAHSIAAQERYRVMFYNVENLFDTKDDPIKYDDEFLPQGIKYWTPKKYWHKLRNISRVITAIGGMQSPVLVGLCEIENDSVIFDLTRRAPLRAQQYEYITTNSPDRRGINVTLLYQPDRFKLLCYQEYEVVFRDPNARPTRNILHATGSIMSGDTLDIFVCHFPSRFGGQLASEPKRMEVAELLRQKTDSTLSNRKKPHIIIMGDFNDQPNNRSLVETLNARNIHSPITSSALYNLFLHHIGNRNFGTYKYAGRWEILDQFIVNGKLLSKQSNLKIKDNKAHIFDADFLLEPDKRYSGSRPFRTYLGPRYLGGFSDHLPIYIDIEIQP